VAADARTIVGLVLARLAEINGAGGYTYDVSGTDQVILDRPITADRLPMVAVYPRGITTVREGVPLGYHGRLLTVEILGFVTYAADTAQSAVYAAMDFADDIATAIEAAEAYMLGTSAVPGATALEVKVDCDTFGGDGMEIPAEVGVVVATLTVKWRVRRGM